MAFESPRIYVKATKVRYNDEADMYTFSVASVGDLINEAKPFGDVDFNHHVRQLVATSER